MGIKLTLDVETPLSDDDRDLLAGISVMVLAIANRQDLADQEQAADDGPPPCGALSHDGQCCTREEGHAGRHRYRPLALAVPGNGRQH